MSRIQYDRVYAWQEGEWRSIMVISPEHLEAILIQLGMRGIVGKRGASTIGPPEGPPR